jgi:hypothetical protein
MTGVVSGRIRAMHVPQHEVDKVMVVLSASCPYRTTCKIDNEPDRCRCYSDAYNFIHLCMSKGKDSVIKMIEEI